MAIVDPWGGYNQGLSTLNSAINGISDRNRQSRMDDMAMQQNQRAMRLSDLQYADLQRKAQEDQQLRDTLANAHGTTQYVPQQQAGPSLASIGQGAMPSQPMPWESPMPQPTTGPQVGMDNKFTPPNPAAITAQVRMSQGRTEEAMKAISLDDALAQYGAKVQAGGGDIRQFYEAKAKLDQGKEFFEAVKPFAKDAKTLKAMWPLLTKVYPQAAAISPDSLTETANGIATPVMTPDGKPVPGKYMLYDNDGKLHIVDNKPPDSGAHNITEIPSRDGKTAQKFQYNSQTQRYDIPVGAAYKVKSQVPSINLTTNSVDPAHQEALDRAVAEKRLDPYKINSRNRQDLARMAYGNPGIDLNGIAAEMGVARNKDVIMKSGIAEMIPGLLKETVNAGKALNYSDAQFVGGIQKWAKGQLNDPKLVQYMTLRNDQLLTLGGVMRNNGMTDMAQRLEEEAARPTMSPRALEGWLEGQLKSIDPRLSLYRNLTKGNAAIPRSTYNPGDGAKKLLGGTSAPKKVGRFTIEVE